MAITFKRSHYIIRVHSFTNDTPLVLCEEVLSCNISRAIENPAHAFNLSLIKVGKYYNEGKIQADDWVEIFKSVTPKEIDALKEIAEKNSKDYKESVEESKGIEVNFLQTGRKGYVRCKRRFLGIIERFDKDTTIKDGVAMTTFTLSGASWGKTIVKQPAMILPYFEGGFPMAKFATSQFGITNTPDKNIKKLLDSFWANEQYLLPKSLAIIFKAVANVTRLNENKFGNVTKKKGQTVITDPSIYDITSFEIKKCDGEVANTQMLTSDNGMFQLIQQYKNPLLNEFWTDLDHNGFPVLVMREYPYTEDDITSELKSDFRQNFFGIESVEIDGSQWSKISTGISSHERYNWFACTSQAHPIGTVLSQKAEIYKEGRIKLDEDSIHRYGLLQYEQGTMYSSFLSKEANKKSFDQLTKYTKLVESWYKKNHEYLNGSISGININDMMLGRRLIIRDIPDDSATNQRHTEAYYCTGVSESWQAYSAPTFQITVVRGRKLTERFGKLNENTSGNYFPSDFKEIL